MIVQSKTEQLLLASKRKQNIYLVSISYTNKGNSKLSRGLDGLLFAWKPI